MKQSKTKRVRRKENRPDEILDAAVAAFEQFGFAAAKISDIAKRAGVAKGTVYLYFETKDQIFEALVRERIRPVFSQIETMKQQFDGTAAELLSTVVRYFYANMVDSDEKRTIMKILISEGSRFPQLVKTYHREVLAKGEGILRAIIDRGVASGEFRAEMASIDPKVVMGPALLAAVHRMAFSSVARMDADRFAEDHINVMLNGLRAK